MTYHGPNCSCNTCCPDIIEIIDVGPGIVEITDQVIYVPPSPDITGIVSEGPIGIQGIQGPRGLQGFSGETVAIAYAHTQGVSASTWNIVHNLNFKPNITIIDSAGSVVEGEIEYLDSNNLVLTVAYAFSGNAYLS